MQIAGLTKRSLFFLESKGLLLVSILTIAAFGALSLLTHWTFSEVYSVHTARYLSSGEYSGDFLFSLKPLFNLFLFISFKMSEWLSVYPMNLARFLFFLNGIIIVFLTWLIVKKQSNAFSAALAVLILVSSPIFLERGFRVRSDLLVTTLSLLVVALALFSRNRIRWANSIFLILSAVIFITPKGIYWFIITGFLLWNELSSARLRKNILPALGGFLSVFLIFGFILKDPFFLVALKKSSLFYWKSLKDAWIFDGFLFNLWQFPFSHISNFIIKNPHLICLTLLKGAFVFYRVFILKRKTWRAADISFLILCCIFLFHPHQNPFFICALQPFFILAFFSDPLWKKLSDRLFGIDFRLFTLSFLSVFTLLMAGLYLGLAIKKNNNFLQKTAIQKLNDHALNFPNVKIYDPRAFLFQRAARHWYNGLYEDNTPLIKEQIVSNGIDVIYAVPYLDIINFRYWQTKRVGWVDTGNHLYYRSWQKKLAKSSGNLTGRKLMKLLKADNFVTDKKDIQKTYWYVFLDQQKHPLSKNKTQACLPQTKGKVPVLEPWCPYTEEEFLKGVIRVKGKPAQAEEIAIMYLPPIKDFPERAFLNALLRYDLFL